MGKEKTLSSFDDLGKLYGLKSVEKEQPKTSFKVIQEKTVKYADKSSLKRKDNNSIENTKRVNSYNNANNTTRFSSQNKPTTPYNFVPLNDVVVNPPLYKYVKDFTTTEDLKKGYKEFLLDGKKYSGYCDIDIENITPLYIGSADKEFFSDGKNLCIPGSSLRGCLKNIFKIITNGTMRIDKENPDITDQILYFRNMAAKSKDSSKALYNTKLDTKNIKAGFLVKENKQYFIYEAEKKEINGKMEGINPNPSNAPCIKWNPDSVDIFSGKIIGKENFYRIANPKWSKKYIIPNDILESYRVDKNRKGLNLFPLDKNGNLSKRLMEGMHLCSFIKRAKNFDYIVPCFFLEYNGVVEHFGANFYYRLPYDKSIGEHISEKLKSKEIDFADAVFGNKECWGSRIAVEDCYLQNDKSNFVEKNYRKDLMSPNPTSFQFYLDTKEGKAQHWNSEAQIRGYKFYWHKKMNWRGVKKPNDKMNNIIAPVKPNNHFKGKIRFENLDAIELGAFMYIFGLAEEDNICYKLGMGKSIGLGSIKLNSKFYFREADYYKKLFDKDRQGFAQCLQEVDKKIYIDQFNAYMKKQLSDTSRKLYEKRIHSLKSILSIKYMMSANSEKWNTQTRYMEIGNRNDREIVTSRIPLPTIEEVIQGLK